MLGPIFARELLTLPRRPRHYALRSVYLGILLILALTAWLATTDWSRPETTGDNARLGSLLFQLITFVQLTLVLFFTALSAAGAISQEKDRRTFVLLLVTNLRNYEIVVGKLLGSLLQIAMLLVGTVPLLFFIAMLGGVAAQQIGLATLILAATALASGSLGGLVALWRDKTFQTLALTLILLVLYLCVAHALDRWTTFAVLFDPVLAWQSVIQYPADKPWSLQPAYGYAAVMLLLSVLLNLLGIVRLRAWNPRGEPVMQRERPEEEEKDRARAHAAPGKVRHVWANPILWREIRTRAYGSKPILVRLAYALVLGLICYYALAPMWTAEARPWFGAARGLLPVGILSMLLVGAQAVTAITSERDSGALSLLLVTDLTPREFIFGKLGGICYNTILYVLPPLILTVVYAWYGWLATPPRLHQELLASRNIASAVCISIATLVLLAFALVLGVHVALRTENSRLAILSTLGTIFFLSVGTLVCIYLIVLNGSNNRFDYQLLNFAGFIGVGIGGLWWVLSSQRSAPALTLASWLCPPAVFYTVTNIIIAKPGSEESADPLVPFLVMVGAFGFTITAMVIPLISEFDVALGRTSGGAE